jgi:TonB-linked outer membrane protein, SusC/RagA family/TonB-dependent outer membrane receptor, SusC/RagA subfamily, signature region
MLFLVALIAGTNNAVANVSGVNTNMEQQEGRCTGVVVDANGETVIGATVAVKDTKKVTITGSNGDFELSGVPVGSTIVITYIGYNTVEVKWTGSPLNVTMTEDSQLLDEVVVVGFGTQKKENLTGSVAQVKMDDVLGDRPVLNATQALQGAMPGLTVGGGSGPGQSKSFNIRGTLSINGGSPLILIDNVEGSIDMLNPEDIESVSVLKDAASAAIYGARAAGGVVLVTTKRPKKETKFTLNYNFNVGWEQSNNLLEQSSLSQYIDAYLEAGYVNTYWAGNGNMENWKKYLGQYRENPSSLNTVGDGIYKDTDGRVYWLSENNMYKKIMDSGFLNNHNVSASGGTDKIRYRMSAGLSSEDGPLTTSKDNFTRKNISAFVSADLLKWFTQEVNISYADSKRQMPENVGNMSGFYTTRLVNYYPEGNMPAEIIGTTEDLPSQTPYNMIVNAPISHNRTSAPRISTRSILKPIEGWTITAEYTFDRKDYDSNFYSSSFKFADCQLTSKNSIESGQDYYQMTNQVEKYNAFNLFSNYENTWGDHNFKAMVGFNQESYYYKYFFAQVKGQTTPSVPSFLGGTGDKYIQDRYSEYAIRSGFARLNYSFKNRYLLELNGRYDGSSKFPKNDRFGFFPSVSVGWRVAEEKFMDWSNNWLDELKLRASYGSIGNQNIAPYQFTPTMSVSPSTVWLNNNDRVSTISSPGLVSSSFTWETVKSLNFGVDINALSNRLQATFDWYKRTTEGMLAAGMEIPGVVGASAPLQNVADMSTNGWEFNITWRDRIGDFNYNVGFNIYDNQSKIKTFNNESGLLSSYYVGQRLGEMWGYESDGYYTIDDFVMDDAKNGVWTLKEGVTSIQGYKVQPGDEKFKDLDGNGVINSGQNTVTDPGDRKIIGNNRARYLFGANLGASYKGFSIDVRLQGVGKRDYWLGGSALFPFAGQGAGDAVFQPLFYNQTDYWRAKSYDPSSPDYMVAENPNSALFRIYDQGNCVGSNTRVSTKYLQDASYLRVKNLTVGYNLPQSLISKVYLQSAKVFVSIENLGTIGHLPKGYDPEGNSGNAIGWQYPYYRTISIGANISF